MARYPRAKRIDASGKAVIPGLIDAHGHLMGLGYALMRVDLVGARDKAEVIARLRDYEKNLPAGAWLLGGGWDQNDWPGENFPHGSRPGCRIPRSAGVAGSRRWPCRLGQHRGLACGGGNIAQAAGGRLAAGGRTHRA